MSDVLQRAKDNYQQDKEYWSEIYRKAREDMYFISDDETAQWDTEDLNIRGKRPCLTIDQLGQFIHKVANAIRMNTPTINVIPATDGDIETAEIFKGLIKNIEYKSNADEAYDTASLSSIRCSIGFFRVEHGYVNEESFDQQLLIKRIVNALSCWIDRESIEVDGSDANRAILLSPISIKAFKAKYPGKDPSSFGEEKSSEKDDDTINIAEYFERVSEEKEAGLTEAGEIEEVREDGIYANKRKLKKTKIKRYLLSGSDILEEGIFPGKYIPIIPVYGEEAWIDGKRQLYSLIRKSRDAQRVYNYWKSLEMELLMKQPNAPIMAGEGQVEDYKEDWQYPQKSMVLRYKTHDAEGNALPAPQRLAPPTIPTGIVNAARETIEDIKATMGLFNASLGQPSNETSGVAIARRKEEGDVATYHFGDNLNKSIEHGGRICVFAAPEVYDTARIVSITGIEDEPKQVGINGARVEGQEKSFDLRKGKYDVCVTTGPSNTTRRQEAADFFTQIVTKQPELVSVMGDLLFKNMDVTGAQAMAERMKKVIMTTNPKLLEEDQGQESPEVQQLKMVIEQGKQLLAQQQSQMAEMQQQLKNKDGETQVKALSEHNKAEGEQGKLQLEILKLQQQADKDRKDNEFKMAALQIKQRELELKEADLMITAGQVKQQMQLDGQKTELDITSNS